MRHEEALKNLFQSVSAFQTELESENVGFMGE